MEDNFLKQQKNTTNFCWQAKKAEFTIAANLLFSKEKL